MRTERISQETCLASNCSEKNVNHLRKTEPGLGFTQYRNIALLATTLDKTQRSGDC